MEAGRVPGIWQALCMAIKPRIAGMSIERADQGFLGAAVVVLADVSLD
jgi:hypothetical protein